MSFFDEMHEAKRYAQSRPYFHPLAIKHAADSIGIEAHFSLALDIACGTGQSTVALSAISDQIYRIDISWSMLANAESHASVQYVLARAEAIPFKDSSIPISSCALAFHWFDRDLFLREAWRVLVPKGLLIVYNNGFTGIMRGNPGFQSWSQEVYPARFPVPPRNSQPITTQGAARAGFVLNMEDRYKNDVNFTPDQLVAYLITQTNVVAALQNGRETVESARKWLLEQMNPFFDKDIATFVFSTRTWYLRKVDSHMPL